jgi:hypothetical protein
MAHCLPYYLELFERMKTEATGAPAVKALTAAHAAG